MARRFKMINGKKYYYSSWDSSKSAAERTASWLRNGRDCFVKVVPFGNGNYGIYARAKKVGSKFIVKKKKRKR